MTIIPVSLNVEQEDVRSIQQVNMAMLTTLLSLKHNLFQNQNKALKRALQFTTRHALPDSDLIANVYNVQCNRSHPSIIEPHSYVPRLFPRSQGTYQTETW